MSRFLLDKVIRVVVIWILFIVAYKLFYPISTVDAVLNQFTNSSTSFGELQLQQIAWKLSFLIPIGFTIFIFRYEIKNLYYKITGGF